MIYEKLGGEPIGIDPVSRRGFRVYALVHTGGVATETRRDMVEWCGRNCSDKFDHTAASFGFANESDALLFYTRWK